MLQGRGEDPVWLANAWADMINSALADKPADMVTSMHLCRGNFRSTFVSSGGYEPVAEVLFNKIGIDGYFLEYDSDRAGDQKQKPRGAGGPNIRTRPNAGRTILLRKISDGGIGSGSDLFVVIAASHRHQSGHRVNVRMRAFDFDHKTVALTGIGHHGRILG